MELYAKNQGKKWYKKWWGMAIFGFGALFMSTTVAFALFVISIIKNQPATEPLQMQQLSDEALKLINGTGKNYWLGAAKPKVTIIEFSDFTCPNSYKSYATIREIGIKYKNDIKLIFRDYPVVSENSADFALSARCAGEQGRFWLMHDKLFINQGIYIDKARELAKQIGADMDRYDSCIKSRKYLADIQKDFDDGKKLGLAGTPAWFINGLLVQGDIPYETFIKLIENLIK